VSSAGARRFAVISDIHANLEGLRAVLDAVGRAGVDRIICLGDIVGYGTDFDACIDLVRERCEVVLRGNHDEALINEPVDFNPVARDAILYTRSIMKPGLLGSSERRERWNYLRGLPESHREGPYSFYHASPREPLKEYVMRTDVAFARDKLREIFRLFEGVCFVGHTHQPGVMVEDPDFRFYEPTEGKNRFPLGRGKVLVNVGSVGQPRDGDNRACFVVVEGDEVVFHRVPYDYETTMKKIRSTRRLHESLALRLAAGK